MATMTATTGTYRSAPAARSASPLSAVRSWIAERRQRGAILRELSQYSTRDLADLGITRGDFTAIAEGRFSRS